MSLEKAPRRHPGKQPNREVFRTMLLSGGTGLEAGIYPLINPACTDMVIAIDVASELAKHQEVLSRLPRHQKVPLGRHTTTDKLLRQHLSPDHELFDHIGVSVGYNGMSQCPAIASISARQVSETRQWKQLKENILNSAVADLNRIPNSFEIHAYCSTPGAAGGGSAPILTVDLANDLARTGAVVLVTLSVIDNIPFTGLGKNVHSNCHAALEMLTEAIVTRQAGAKPSNVVFELVVSSLPAALSPEERQALHLQVMQGWNCPELANYRQISGPNYALASSYGNITLVVTSFFEPLPPDDLAGFVSHRFESEIIDKLDAMVDNLDPLHDFYEDTTVEVLSPLPISKVIDRVGLVDKEQLVAGICSPISEAHYEFIAIDRRERNYELSKLLSHFATTPTSFNEAVEGLAFVRAVDLELKILLNEGFNDRSELLKEIEKSKYGVGRRLEKLQARAKGARWISRLIEDAEHLRFQSTQLHHLDSRLARLTSAQEDARVEIAKQLGRLDSLQLMLRSHIRPQSSSNATPLVTLRPIDEVFGALLDATHLSEGIQRHVLCSAVREVTLHGLATIVGSNSIRIEDIVDAIFSADSPMKTCWPGGFEREVDTAAFVLPPLSIQHTAELKADLAKRDAKVRNSIFISDSARVGCNVVRFGFIHPTNIEEIFSPLAKSAYEAASKTPTGMLSSEKAFRQAISTHHSEIKTTSFVVDTDRLSSGIDRPKSCQDRENPVLADHQSPDESWTFIVLPGTDLDSTEESSSRPTIQSNTDRS